MILRKYTAKKNSRKAFPHTRQAHFRKETFKVCYRPYNDKYYVSDGKTASFKESKAFFQGS